MVDCSISVSVEMVRFRNVSTLMLLWSAIQLAYANEKALFVHDDQGDVIQREFKSRVKWAQGAYIRIVNSPARGHYYHFQQMKAIAEVRAQYVISARLTLLISYLFNRENIEATWAISKRCLGIHEYSMVTLLSSGLSCLDSLRRATMTSDPFMREIVFQWICVSEALNCVESSTV